MGFWRKLFGAKPRVGRPPKSENQAETLAEQIVAVQYLCGAKSWERDLAGQDIRLCFLFPNGEKICGQGPTTYDAFRVLRARIKKVHEV